MNIAIILAVSDYKNAPSLPGCVLDGQLVKRLLDATGKYAEILFIKDETDSVRVKEKLADFVTSISGKAVDEVFYYYTGHGDFRDNEFYYILSDFHKDSYRQTSLENSELDNLLRQLNSDLTIKIIDACNSGVTYIKDIDIFSKHLDESKRGFKRCYFMFSSMNNQSSYQTSVVSHFTKSFLDSVIKYSSTEIRYKHIIDHISDEFDKNAYQKPLFVIQANLTEFFCSVNQKIKILSGQMSDLLENTSDNKDLKLLSLVDLIKEDAKKYCSEGEILKILDTIKNYIEDYKYSFEFTELYEILPEFEDDYSSISRYDDSIGKWLKDNSNNYFSEVTYRRELIGQDSSSGLGALANSFAYLYGDKHFRNVITGFDLTVDVPFKLININADPKYPNIDLCDCKIAFVFSQVSIRFFYFFSNFKLKTWQEYSHSSSSDWQTVEVETKDLSKLQEAISNVLDEFDSFVLSPLRAKYILTVDSRVIQSVRSSMIVFRVL